MLTETVQTMANRILREKAERIRGRFFTIMLDETTDQSTKEQCVIVIRWVDECLKPHEEFIGLYELAATDAATIVTVMHDLLLRLGLGLQECRGQCYDGASVMLGMHNGVATQILTLQPKALYTHCFGHSFNLACQDMIRDNKKIRDALDTVFEL